MKNALTRKIIVCVAVNLMTAGFALAQNAAEEEKQASKEALVAEKQAELAERLAQKKAEAAAKVAQQAEKQTPLEQIQNQLNQLLAEQKQLELQFPKIVVPTPPTPPTPRTPRVSIPGWQYSGIGSILVIPTAQMKTEDLAAITEDMSVMSRIFDKKLSQAQLITGGSWSELSFALNPRSFGRSSGAIEAIYLEGYGALFLMRVNALLSPPPESLEEKEPKEEDTDPLWTQMRQEIYAPEEVDRLRRSDRPEEKYDAEKVAEFRETLIKTLKHAANIRNLKPDESVILTVIGKAGQSGTKTATRSSYGRSSMGSSTGRRGRSRMVRVAPGVPTVAASLLPTVLTIRAKKSDIDAFAKGQLTFDQFRQKTQLLSYSYLGENVGGPSRSSQTRMSDHMSEMMLMRDE